MNFPTAAVLILGASLGVFPGCCDLVNIPSTVAVYPPSSAGRDGRGEEDDTPISRTTTPPTEDKLNSVYRMPQHSLPSEEVARFPSSNAIWRQNATTPSEQKVSLSEVTEHRSIIPPTPSTQTYKTAVNESTPIPMGPRKTFSPKIDEPIPQTSPTDITYSNSSHPTLAITNLANTPTLVQPQESITTPVDIFIPRTVTTLNTSIQSTVAAQVQETNITYMNPSTPRNQLKEPIMNPTNSSLPKSIATAMNTATSRSLGRPQAILMHDQSIIDDSLNSTSENLTVLFNLSTRTSTTNFLSSSPTYDLSSDLNYTISPEHNISNCSNDYCIPDADYIDLMVAYVFPTWGEWVLITMHGMVFVVGLVGNALVCVAVYRNHTMRTVTNYFIVNLAVADFLVILLCLPPTVLWDVTETWFMGTALCKIVLYFQTVSVTVSVLTLVFISLDRWYAICFPLKFKSTTSRAKKAICLIWVLALAFDIPELVVLETQPKELRIAFPTVLFTQCLPTWGPSSDMAFHCVKTLFLYTLPLIFMSVAYYQIVRVLWSKSNIPGHAETSKFYPVHNSTLSCNGNGTTGTARRALNRNMSANQSSSSQVISRRKAAKMLVAVCVMFAMCYFPVHLLSILRYAMDVPQTEYTTFFAMLSHWMCYANSAVNPLIYNFMSGKFREEFRRAFHQCSCVGTGTGTGWACAGARAGDTVRPARSLEMAKIPAKTPLTPQRVHIGMAPLQHPRTSTSTSTRTPRITTIDSRI